MSVTTSAVFIRPFCIEYIANIVYFDNFYNNMLEFFKVLNKLFNNVVSTI